jgi:hypothetical protein
MESALKLSVLAQPFGVGDALKSWFGLFNLFLEAHQIIVTENLHALTFSDIATSRELLRHQLQLITSSRSATLVSDREVNNLPLAAGLAGARRVDPLKVVHSPVSLTRQERRRAYRRKRNARLNSPPFQCGPPAVEPQFINSHSSFLTDCESDLTDNSFITSSKEGGVTDFNDSIDTVSNPEKLGVMTSTIVLSASTSVSTVHKFPPRQPFKCPRQPFKCSFDNSCRLVLQEIAIPAWPTHYSNAYNLFQLSSFNATGCIFPNNYDVYIGDKIRSQDSSITLPVYFRYGLNCCVHNYCKTQLKCCSFCGDKCNKSLCLSNCSDCTSDNHSFYSCPKLLRWLHDPDTSHHILWKDSVRDWIVSNPPPHL